MDPETEPAAKRPKLENPRTSVTVSTEVETGPRPTTAQEKEDTLEPVLPELSVENSTREKQENPGVKEESPENASVTSIREGNGGDLVIGRPTASNGKASVPGGLPQPERESQETETIPDTESGILGAQTAIPNTVKDQTHAFPDSPSGSNGQQSTPHKTPSVSAKESSIGSVASRGAPATVDFLSPKTSLVVTHGRSFSFLTFVRDLKARAAETVTETAIEKIASVEGQVFDHVHFCINVADLTEETVAKYRAAVEPGSSVAEKASRVTLHFDFSGCKDWFDEPQSLKNMYNSLMAMFEKKCVQKVTHCSFTEKFSKFDSDVVRVNKEVVSDIERWKRLEILDYTDSYLRVVAGIEFPDSIHTLNLGSCFLQSLKGCKFPSKLRNLDLSRNRIASTQDVQFPPTLERLSMRENKLYFINSVDFPPLLKHLDLSENNIDNIKGMNFPRNLEFLSLAGNPIECMKGARFPESIQHLDVSCSPNESMTGVKFPDGTKDLNLSSSMTNTRGLKLPPYVEKLNLSACGVNSINPLKLPNSISVLDLAENNIKTLNKVVFPAAIRELHLGENSITTLKNVQFPPELEVLDLDMDPDNEDNKYLTTLKDVYFPPNLRELRLHFHTIKAIEGIDFPYGLEKLVISMNDLQVFRNVKFGPKLRSLDLSQNDELTSLDGVYLPESLQELVVPARLLPGLPGYVVERANFGQLTLKKSE